MMTKNQINIAVKALLNRADIHIREAQVCTQPHAESSWIAHMTASMMCSDLVAALLDVRKTLETEDAPSEKIIS